VAEAVRRSAKAAFALIAVAVVVAAGLWVSVDSSSAKSYTLPNMYIDTDGYDTEISHDSYTDCTITLDNCDSAYELDNEDAEIRGRGNTSWYGNNDWYELPKKPFKIRFAQSVDLLGNGSYTEWTLIANCIDQSLSRDYLAYNTAALLGLYSSSTTFVNVWLDGNYEGVYLLCDQLEVAEGRVYTTDDSGTAYTYQYLLEMNGWAADDEKYSGGAVEGVDYFTLGYHPYEFADPDGDELADGEFDTVQSLFETVVSMLQAGPDSYSYSEIQAYLDTDSFAKTYIVNEVFTTQDINWSSFYFTVYGNTLAYEGDDHLTISSGPVWDFDTSSGNTRNQHTKDPDNLWAYEMNGWYHSLLQYDEFKTEVADLLAEYTDEMKALWDTLYEEEKQHQDDFDMNFDRWPFLGVSFWSNPLEFVQLRTWNSHIEYLIDWLDQSLDYVNSQYSAYATSDSG
jgi:hypothetical protein